MLRAILCILASVLALPAHAQSDAEKMFRKWADERVEVLRKSATATSA